jgi:hypothetical protein
MIEVDGGISGYGNLLPIVLLVYHSHDWWLDIRANIHVCINISLFSSYQVGRTSSLSMGNGVHAAIRGVDIVYLKLPSEDVVQEVVQLKNVYHIPSVRKNLISGSLLCHNGYKLMFESNKCVIPKYGFYWQRL